MVIKNWLVEARELFQQGNSEAALKLIDAGLEESRLCIDGWELKGRILQSLGRYVESVEANQEVLNLLEAGVLSSEVGWSVTPEDFFNAGNLSAEDGAFEDAVTSYDRALQINPNNYQSWSNRGNVLSELGRKEEAITSYDCALQINPDYYIAWFNRGNVLSELGRKEEAIASYGHVLQINPDYYIAWFNRAIAICYLGVEKLSSTDLLGMIRRCPISALRQPEPHVAALQEALPHLTENSENWARIHLAIGDAYLKHAKYKQNPSPYWRDAVRSYQTAYPILSAQKFPEDRLKVLQGLIRVYLAFEDIPTARRFQQEGKQLFEQLRPAKAAHLKPAFERKFASFAQLEIDLFIGDQNPIAALEQAEFYKNRCLTWILDSWKDSLKSPSYSEVKQLADTQTAIIYWHLSVDSLTTFFLTTDRAEPVVLTTNRRQQAQQLQQWLGTYLSQYRSYANQKPKSTEFNEQTESDEHLVNHPWRKSLTTQIDKLRSILQIDAISQQLPDTINRLILVPHRDLHCVPLQSLFADRFTCTFLPSLQIGLQLQADHSPLKIAPLLNIEDPETDQLEMRFAHIESAVIQRLIKDSVSVSKNAASLETVTEALHSPYKTFHFNGHGAYNPATPSASALGLTDGLLTAKQINQLNLKNYQLICLAACETALTGKDGIPDEYVGLASAFLKAGASNVLSTLWPIDEIASAWIMIRFYQGLLAGKTPAVALKAAQTWIQTISKNELANWINQLSQLPGLPPNPRDRLKAHAENIRKKEEGTMEPNQSIDYSHPYYWAAFTLTGWG